MSDLSPAEGPTHTDLPEDPAEAAQRRPSSQQGVCGRCGKRWGGHRTAHCAACHQTFSADSVADQHRKGTHTPDTRHCVDPATIGLVVNRNGYWGNPPDPDGNDYWMKRKNRESP